MVLPKEHGTWMMFFLPYLLGMFLSGANWLHLFFMVGWFFVFLTSTPLLSIIRKPRYKAEMLPWVYKYSVIALIFVLPIIWIKPILLWGIVVISLLLGVSSHFIKIRQERSLWNNLSGILIFSLGGIAAYIIGQGSLTKDAIILLIITTLYFMSSAFYVKSLIRERKNTAFKRRSHIYHGLLLLVPFLLNIPWLVIAYVPSVCKDFLTSRKEAIKPIKIGIMEIINGLVFFIICLYVLR
ncbi:hypothetical protein CEQ21_03390 [Niallia circulans]|uniref:YwiC-like protein n=1 Tax=Niallia circulans TaxID=1397 RepID=A0A553SSP7_NIACI|nr:YwiC-like family protein [Niallia circulans]TRZ39998.1 hypothetical protein CEQ21_03390 [Niallia circulans]